MKINLSVNVDNVVARGISVFRGSERVKTSAEIQRDEMVDIFVKRAQNGDADAFGKIYDMFADQIYRYVYFKASEDDVEDIVETVFLKAWEKIHQYKTGKKSFSSWIFRIAHNLVVDSYRARKDKETVELTPDVAEYRREHNPIRVTEDKIHSDALKDALSAIKPRYRQVLILKFINELSNQEISGVLKKSEGSLRILQFRALRALKAEFERNGINFA